MTNSNLNFITYVLLTSYIINVSYAKIYAPKAQKLWAKTQPYGHDQKTTLEFYFHDNRTGDFQTVALIAQPIQATTSTSASGFGNLYMIDDPLTLTPNPHSKLLGRAQGFYGSASMESVSYIMGFTFSFVDGVHNGSTVVILGRNTIGDPIRELPVVGGTGIFRMARGYALAQTVFHNNTAHNAIVGYNVTIFHS